MWLVISLAALAAWGCGDGDSTPGDDGGGDPGIDAPREDAGDVAPDETAETPSDDAGEVPADDAADATDDGAPPPTEDIHYSGRFDRSDPAAPSFDWSGTSIGARFSGTGVSVTLDAQGQNFFEVVLDGTPRTVVETAWGEQTLPLAAGLPAGEHDVLIVRRTEAFANAVAFLGFTVEGGAIVPSPSPWTHRLEFVGDSITAGYGAEGVGPSCSFSLDTESAYASYASVAARALDAEAHLIAYSGKGVYQNYGGDTTEPMPALYERTLGSDAASVWDFSYQAEAVLINLGTNDFSASVNQATFESAYSALILLVRSHHPAAAIYCIAGAIMNPTATAYITNAIAASGDANTHLLELPAVDPGEGWGCDYHPSAASHARFGGLVADRLRADLGW
jgi:lysophospholipase L1-like esterase